MKAIKHFIFVIILSTSNIYATNNDFYNLKKYVMELITESYEIVNNKELSEDQKEYQAKILLIKNLDTNWMSQNVLGKHRRSLTKNKINQFKKIYSKFVINSYASLINKYNGETAHLTNVRKINNNMFIVKMTIENPHNKTHMGIDYMVRKNLDNNTYKVADIITEGISILNSQQSEFNSVINKHGIDALIKDLQSKITS